MTGQKIGYRLIQVTAWKGLPVNTHSASYWLGVIISARGTIVSLQTGNNSGGTYWK